MAENRSADWPSSTRALSVVASVLCWIWGGVFGYYGILAVEGIKKAGGTYGLPTSFLVIVSAGIVLLAIANCLAGYFLVKERRLAEWMRIVPTTLQAAALFLLYIGGHVPVQLGLAINFAILVLLTARWLHLRNSDKQVDA
jgi:hypothetical protein